MNIFKISGLTGLALLALLSTATGVIAGQGAGRMLYTAPNTTFIEKPSGEVVVTVNDVSGSIATLQAAIDSARAANPTNIIVIRLLDGATYFVSSAGLTLGSRQCLIAKGATIRAANASVTVPLITIASGSTNVSVAGGTLEGAGANLIGIHAPAATRVNIDKVIVRICGLDGILLRGQGNSTYDNEMTVTRCDVSGSPANAGINIQNSTQTIVADNNCHDNAAGIRLSCAWALVVNNTCWNNTTGIDVAGGNDNVISNNTCDNNGTGIRAGASNGMITSNSTGTNSTAGILSNGSGNTFIDNFFTGGNALNFSSSGSGNRVVAYKTSLSASGQNYFYPPLIDNPHTNTIVNGMGRTDVTIGSTTIASVQTQYDAARAANPNNVIVLHLNGTFTLGSSPLNLYSNTCVLLNGTIQFSGSTTADPAVRANGVSRVSISGGIIDGGNFTGNTAVHFSSSSMMQVDAMTLRNFGPSSPRVGGSDVVHFAGGSTPYIVTRCLIDGGSARGIWLQLNGPKSMISDNEVTDVNQDGVDCDSSTKGCVAKYNYCHDLVRYGVFIEQSASYNQAFGNVCNNTGRNINLYNNYATHRAPVERNTVAFNWCLGGNGIRNGSTGTNTVVTSHNFLFNNTVVNASILSQQIGIENYYSQNYHVGTLSTSGAESFFNSARVSTNQFLSDANSRLAVLVQNAATSNGAALIIGAAGAAENDLWALIPTDSGWYQLKNKKSGLVAAVSGAATNAGAQVVQWTFGSGKNDQWMPMSAGNGLWFLVNRKSGLCLNVSGGGTSPGTLLDQQVYIGAAHQKFALTLDPPEAEPPFFLSANPLLHTVGPGATTNYTVTLTTNAGFVGPVTFALSGLPTNALGNFSPPSLSTGGISTLTVSIASNTLSGNYPLTITGSDSTATNTLIVSLIVASPGSNLLWNATASTAWDTTSPNWFNELTESADLFQDGKNVVFADRAGVLTNVTLASGTSVAPAAVTVNSDTNHYVISGAGKISGATGLLKTGESTLTVATVNDFTGKTIVQGGVLNISAETGLGANPAGAVADQLTLDGGTLQTLATFTIDDANRGITVGGSGGTFDVVSNTFTIAKSIAGGVVTKTGDGTLALNVVNTYIGGSFASAGSFRANIVGAYGSGPVNISGIGVAYLNVSGTHTNDFDIQGIGPVEATGQFGAIRFANNSATATTLTGTITLGGDARISARGISYSNPGAIIAGQITGSAALEFGNSGNTANPGRITLLNQGNDWWNDTTIFHGTVRLGASQVIPNGPEAGNVIIYNSNPTNDSILDLNGFNETINGLSSAGPALARCVVTNSSATAATLTLGDYDSDGDFGGIIRNGSGTVALTKIGAGTQTLGGANAYTGITTVSQGTLIVNGALGNSAVTVQNGAMLGGNGVIGGSVSVLPGGAVSPGASIGRLTVNSTIALQGAAVMELNKAGNTNDVLRSTGSIVFGGTLALTNVNGALGVSDSFKLFDAAGYSGAFAVIVPSAPGPGLAWNTNQLNVNGTLTIVAASQPVISGVSASGGALVLSGTNGAANATYYVMASTNVALAFAQWTSIATNLFDSNGNFQFTNTVDQNEPQKFYLLKLP